MLLMSTHNICRKYYLDSPLSGAMHDRKRGLWVYLEVNSFITKGEHSNLKEQSEVYSSFLQMTLGKILYNSKYLGMILKTGM